MKRLMKKVLILMLILAPVQVFGQQQYKLSTSGSSVKIKGTSTLHDWSMDAEGLSATMSAVTSDGLLQKVTAVNFSCPVEKIVSNESSMMDSKAHDAFKSEKNPTIKFNFTGQNSINAGNDQVNGTITGNLSMAGETKSIKVSFSGKVLGSGHIVVTGTKSLKMSDYGMDPPTAMFGTISSGDEVTIVFTLEFMPAD
ncbi:MAG TPA: YceI family protein [Bacteroidales bacterium]|nr:YceI family protein [Bacteroidales bacterium]